MNDNVVNISANPLRILANDNLTDVDRLDRLLSMLDQYYDDIRQDPKAWSDRVGKELRCMSEKLRAVDDALKAPFRSMYTISERADIPRPMPSMYVPREDYDRWQECERIIKSWKL